MARLTGTIGIVLLVLATLAHGQTKTPGDLLQEGLYAEQTEGDLDKAIGIYTEVLEQAGEVQRLAAQASYQLGMCYLKKDDTGKAAEYFRQVATKYADEKSLARRAANKLKRLVPAASAVVSSAPHVVRTTPAALANNVDPGLDRITVTFNMPMMDQSWSWTGGGDTYPQTTGRPYYDTTRTTCTMPVKLEPGKVYWVGINSPSHKNFKTPDRDPVPWTIILFATRGTDGSPTPIPQDLFDRAKSINQRSQIQKQEKNAPTIVGRWQSVDFVSDPKQFQPNVKQWQGELFLKELTFNPDGTTSKTFRWTNGWIHSAEADVKAQYHIKTLNSEKYLFFPWLSGDVIIRGQKPKYYVLKAIRKNVQVPVQNGQEAIEYTFSPIMETVINDDGVGENFMFDLDKGKSYSLSDANEWRGSSDISIREKLEDFVMNSGVDLFGETSKNCLLGINMIAVPVQNAHWNRSPDYVVSQLAGGTLGTLVPLSADGELPKTFAFKTGQGSMGLLQIMNVQAGKAPRHFTIQYILLQEQPENTIQNRKGWNLLDEETQQTINSFEKTFADYFKNETRYELAGETQKEMIISEWEKDALGDNFNRRVGAIAALGNVKAADAVDTLIKIAEEPMNNNRPKWMAVRGLAQIGDARAIPTLIGLIDHGNTNVRVYARLGLATITGVYFKDSKEAWIKWWKENKEKYDIRDPKKSKELTAEGWKLWGQRKLLEAEEAFKQAIVLDPDAENAYQGLGWAQLNQGKRANATDAFEKCIAINPENSAALNGLGWIAHGQGNSDEAITWWEKAVNASGGNATASLSGLTQVYMDKKDYAKAAQYFEMWLKAEPNNAQARDGLKKAETLMKSH